VKKFSALSFLIIVIPSLVFAQSTGQQANSNVTSSTQGGEQRTSTATLQQQIQDLLRQLQILQAQVAAFQGEFGVSAQATSTASASEAVPPELTRSLSRGSSGDDVRKLQEFLAKDKDVYPDGLVTGYFGPLTEKAVKKWQEKQGIDPVGVVGPKTLAALNQFVVASISQPGTTSPAIPAPAPSTPSSSIITTAPIVGSTTTISASTTLTTPAATSTSAAPTATSTASSSSATTQSAAGTSSTTTQSVTQTSGGYAGGYTVPTTTTNTSSSTQTSSATATTTQATSSTTGGTTTSTAFIQTCSSYTNASSKIGYVVGDTVMFTFTCVNGNTKYLNFQVMDSSGAIALATNWISNSFTNDQSGLITADKLSFSSSNLSPGTYKLRACFDANCQNFADVSSFTLSAAGSSAAATTTTQTASSTTTAASATSTASTTSSTASCTGFTLTFANGKTSYIVGDTLTYTYACSSSGTASLVEVSVSKPDGSITVYNTSSGSVSQNTLGFSTSNLSPGNYTLRACFTAGCSGGVTASLPFTVTAAASVPPAPSNLAVVFAHNGGDNSTTFNLTWGGTPANITSWRVYQHLQGTAWPSTYDTRVSNQLLSSTATTLTVQVAIVWAGYGTYEFKMEACNSAGCSPDSNSAAIAVSSTTATSSTSASNVSSPNLALILDALAKILNLLQQLK